MPSRIRIRPFQPFKHRYRRPGDLRFDRHVCRVPTGGRFMRVEMRLLPSLNNAAWSIDFSRNDNPIWESFLHFAHVANYPDGSTA